MANIANPLAGTKIDGSTFNAAECNAVGASLVRCLVNDGPGDLIANASISGGTNKSFALVDLTTFGVACANALTETCGSRTSTCAGASAQTCRSFAITTTSGGMALTSFAGIDIEASATVSLDVSGGNIQLTSDEDIVLSSLAVPAAAAAFSGTGWPSLGARTLTVAPPLDVFPVQFDVSFVNPFWLRQNGTGSAVVVVWLHLPPGSTLNGATVRLQSIGQPAAVMPGTKPRAQLVAANLTTGAAVGINAFTTSDASANVAAYAAWHSIAVVPDGGPYVVPADVKVGLVIFGAVDAASDTWARMLPPTVSLTVDSLRFL